MKRINLLNPPDLSHLKRLTNFQGLIQHSKLRSPDKKHGYSIDDNARALVVVYKYAMLYKDNSVLPLAHIYFDYIKRAQLTDGLFHNFAKYSGEFIDTRGSDDSFGRTIWALGYIASNKDVDMKLASKARRLLKNAAKNIEIMKPIKTKAFMLLGYYFLKDKNMVVKLADALVDRFNKCDDGKWRWFEEKLTYSNAILPYSLFLAYELTGEKEYLKVAEISFEFLDKTCKVKNIPAPIGQNGWYKKGEKKALYDQQVVDVADMILAANAGGKLTGKKEYFSKANQWWEWFFGNNILNISLIETTTGGCYDGITPKGTNLNQGAESIVCYLLAYLEMAQLHRR